MTATPSIQEIGNSKTRISFFFTLVVAGLAGNYFKFPIFLNIDFLFGSIFALLALQFFGLGRGILAAALIASYTYVLWNHPYAIIIMTAEVAVVGWLMARRKMGLVLADTLYWLIIGMPLVYLFYHLVMQVPLSNTYIVMTKQAINGIANALIARTIFTAYALVSRSTLTSYKEIIYNLLALFVLCPALIVTAVSARTDFKATDRQIRTELDESRMRLEFQLNTWLQNRKMALLNLAEMAAIETPQQIQPHLEQARMSDVNFLRIGLADKTATIIAYSPLVDKHGHKNIGKNFADRPDVQQLQKTLKPLLSEVHLDRIGKPEPRVLLRSPVLVQKVYAGYIAGILSLRQLKNDLASNASENALLYSMVDKRGYVIMTNRTDQAVMKPFVRDTGKFSPLDIAISQWIPTLPPNTPAIERWRKSLYVTEASVGDLAEWRLILEQPIAPYQKILYAIYAERLFLLFLLLLTALALAEFLSRKVVVTLEKLNRLTHELPAKLTTEGEDIRWPKSRITEADQLIGNFKQMAHSLLEQFNQVKQSNELLEQRVDERTAALQESEQRLTAIFDQTKIHLWAFDGTDFIYTNKQWFDYTGQDPSSTLTIEGWQSVVHPDDAAESYAIWAANLEGKTEYDNYFRLRRHDGVYRDFICHAFPIFDDQGGFKYFQGFNLDITERKQIEQEFSSSRLAGVI